MGSSNQVLFNHLLRQRQFPSGIDENAERFTSSGPHTGRFTFLVQVELNRHRLLGLY
jgi:hypothetical protein